MPANLLRILGVVIVALVAIQVAIYVMPILVIAGVVWVLVTTHRFWAVLFSSLANLVGEFLLILAQYIDRGTEAAHSLFLRVRQRPRSDEQTIFQGTGWPNLDLAEEVDVEMVLDDASEEIHESVSNREACWDPYGLNNGGSGG